MIRQVGKNRYQFILSIGSGENRKRPSKTITFKGGKKELQRLHDEFEAQYKDEPLPDITIEQLLKDYIAHCKAMGRKPETIRGYKISAERCYSPVGTILAKKCTTYRLQKFVAEMSSNGLASKTVKNTIGLLSAAYEYGIRTDQLDSNPCKKVTLPKGKQRDVRIFYLDEIQPFLNAIAECPIDEKLAYELALFMGLRKSELLGLRESDVDLIGGLLSVENTRHRTEGVDIEQDTKTERSTRVLAMPDIVMLDMARLLETHRQLKYKETDLLIQDGFGSPLGGSALASRLSRLEEKKGLPHVTLHGLRHTYASLLNARGVDMAMISAELGHSNLATTMNIYTHRFKTPTQSSRNIASAVDDFVAISAKSGDKMVIEEK